MVLESLDNLRTKIEEAASRIDGYISKTNLISSLWLKEESLANVYLKMESEQITNSFKARGACNAIISKRQENALSGKEVGHSKFLTASSGNHGLACCYAMSRLGSPDDLTVYLASSAAEIKVKAIKGHGANVVIHGMDCVVAEQEAQRVGKETGVPYLSPYNDLQVIFGQGTIGKEIYDCLPSVDAVFVPVGGGGLVSGIALYLKSRKPEVKVIGCQPLNSCVMYESVKAGKILDIESKDTLSNGTAGGVDAGSVTFEICQKYVDEWILVTEEEIELALYKTLQQQCKMVEGAAGVAIAAFMKTKEKWKNQNVVLICCGGNISTSTLRMILDKYEGKV